METNWKPATGVEKLNLVGLQKLYNLCRCLDCDYTGLFVLVDEDKLGDVRKSLKKAKELKL